MNTISANPHKFEISRLGEAKLNSPLNLSSTYGDSVANYMRDSEKLLYKVHIDENDPVDDLRQYGLIEKAGPREKIFFNPRHVHAAILTCGGLCPGLNDVIRGLVRTLWNRYGVRRISGIRYGYHGFLDQGSGHEAIMELNPDIVDDIHRVGGSILGSSRGGGERTEEIVDSIERLNLNMLFVIGGDGTQKGALKIAQEIEKRGLNIAVVGVPKTIDNDLLYCDRSFGFETAVMRATEAVYAAHQEANSALNGIGLVKVMGRDSGFIAASTTLASHDVNLVLVPEVPFDLEGPNGLYENVKRRLEKRGHIVILVAEGAGQEHLAALSGSDESGNKKLSDIGTFLRDDLTRWFKEQKVQINLKYIDPSYLIRSSVAIASDSYYCTRLASNAVHAAMSGRTKMIISRLHNTYVHIPTEVAVAQRNKLNPESSLWLDVLQATSQPTILRNTVDPTEPLS